MTYQPRRILSVAIAHETNTFCELPTTLDDFRGASPTPDLSGGQKILDHYTATRTIHGGFLDAAKRRNLTVEPLLWTFPTPGGTVDHAAYLHLKKLFLDRLKAAGPCDGVFLDLHGAMVTSECEDAEGDLAQAVTQTLGNRIPIVMTLDLHATLTPLMVRHTNVIVGFDEYPHTDMYERGYEAGLIMADLAAGILIPSVEYRPLPLLTMPVSQCTEREPMQSILAAARAAEKEENIRKVTLISGFAMADVRDAGMAVLVTADADQAAARRVADRLAQLIWDRREEFTPKLTPIADALQYAQSATGLVILADGSDNPGAGGTCDTTELLSALLEARVPDAVVNCIHDPAAVAAAQAAGEGTTLDIEVGGRAGRRYGAPVQMQAQVVKLTNGNYIRTGAMGAGEQASFGPTAVLKQGGVQVIVTTRREQPYDIAFPRSLGIEPSAHRLMAIKSIAHFRGCYAPLAQKIFDMDTQGIARPDFCCYNYKNLRRPIYPLDPKATYTLPTP